MPLAADQLDHLRRIKASVPVAESGGVPGAVMVAQGTIESGWGRSALARLGCAYFGIKAHASWPGAVYSGTTSEVEGGRYVRHYGTNRVYPSFAAAAAAGCDPVALFRAYPDFERNVEDYVAFFHRNPRYALALSNYAAHKDPMSLADDVGFAEDIARAGYATSRTYAQTLRGFILSYCQDLLLRGADAAANVPALVRVLIAGRELPRDAVEFTKDGRVFAHVRALAEAAQWQVSWDAAERTVTVTP